MSATLDANVLLYASDETSPFHARAIVFLEQLARGPELLYLFWPTVMAYLRIATHPSVFASPLPPADAVANVESLLALPHVQTSGERERFWSAWRDVTGVTGVSGNLVPDAHLAALMRENGVRRIWTNDRDFRRFDGVEVRDPFA
jgi:toxin-antitoxin system PIN domain toxin